MASVDDLTRAMLVLMGYYDDRYNTKDNEWSIIKVQLPQGLAQQIAGWGSQHMNGDILCNGETPGRSDSYGPDYGLERDIHITIRWGIHTNDPLAAIRAIDRMRVHSFDVRLGKVSIFDTSPEYDVVKIETSRDGLEQMHKAIPQYLKSEPDTHPTYNPHITIGYVTKGNGDRFVGVDDFDGEVVHIDRVMFCASNGRETVIPLAGVTL